MLKQKIGHAVFREQEKYLQGKLIMFLQRKKYSEAHR